MADGVAITAGSGTTVATDDAGASGHVQLFKLAYSADGVATLVTADGNGLEVQLGVALPAGTNAIGKLAANNGVDIGDVDVASLPAVDRPSTATLTNVSASASSVTLLAAWTGAEGRIIYNDSTASLYVKFGTTASTTSFTYLLLPNDTLELPQPVYTGRVDGIWSAANGSARITELSA